jgi:hypothetical protein
MSRQEGTDESVVDVLRTAELRKSKPEHNNSLEKVVECYTSRLIQLRKITRRIT